MLKLTVGIIRLDTFYLYKEEGGEAKKWIDLFNHLLFQKVIPVRILETVSRT